MVAQTPVEVRQFHDQAVSAIARTAGRPLTPGDTFLTWNPGPGGLIHTVRIVPSGVSSSLLRGDGMIGTAEVRWQGGNPSGFEVRWTRQDAGGKGIDSATTVIGERQGAAIRVRAGGISRTLPLPSGPWAVADYGMEEQLIPAVLALPARATGVRITVLRPYHVRWDTVVVSVRDTAGLRLAELMGTDKAHELMVLGPDGALLWMNRFDQAGERRPLEGTSRYAAFVTRRSLLASLSARYSRP
jgi:hypothetical protein